MVAGLINGELIAPMTYEETMTSDFFEAWFQKFLLPTLSTPSVIIMDNARFHRMSRLEHLCEEYGHKLLPLPPYSPEYNPIEKTWAHIKKHLRKVLPNCDTFLEALLFLFQLTIIEIPKLIDNPKKIDKILVIPLQYIFIIAIIKNVRIAKSQFSLDKFIA